ncbi:MAG: efflux RND transporter periplasmic adaptor subunit [Thermodesulfobacteriota bacterium]
MKKVISLIVLSLLWASQVTAAQEDKPALAVVTDVETEIAAKTVEITGNLYFERTSNISSEISGKAESVFFEEGDRLSKGAKLVKADTELLEKEMSLYESELAQLNVKIEKTKKDLKRYEDLYKNNAASESAYDDLYFAHKGLLEEKAALIKKIDMMEIRLDKSTVYAPFRGIVLEKNVDKGSWVQPGSPLCRLGDLDSVSIKVPVSQKFIRFSKPGDKLDVYLTAVDKNLKGTVIGFMPYAEAKTRNLYLKIAIDYDGPLAENMTAKVDVFTSAEKEVFLVPRDAVVDLKGKKAVYSVKDNKPLPVFVEIVGYKNRLVRVKSKDLKKDMKIIIEGNERLKPDQKVKIVGEE